MSISAKFAAMAVLIVCSMLGGYLCGRRGRLGERWAEVLMTIVLVAGYPSVGFLAIWTTRLAGPDLWLPSLGIVHVLAMAALAWGLASVLRWERAQRGLFIIAGSAGNIGFTMGGFVIYLLYGEQGLGLASIYAQILTPMTVLVYYPLARRHAAAPAGGLGRLMFRSLFDWRSLGLPAAIAAAGLSLAGVPRPGVIDRLCVVDVLMFLVTGMAYFSIALRLHLREARPAGRLIAWSLPMRFVVGAAVGWALAAATLATAWPMEALARNVLIIESFVPTAVTMVGVANMFGLEPRRASVLFVANTLFYLVVVLPVVMAVFRL
jgi:predicted permease